MSLKERLLEEMKQAMKKGNKLKLEVIRLLRSRIKNVEIDKGDELDDVEIQKVVQQQIKQWKDALQDYERGGRADLVQETESKIKLLGEYMPEQLSDEELEETINKVKETTGIDQVGPLIGKVKQEVGNKAEGSRIAKLVNQLME